jgi:hypothetical protein
MISFEKYLFQKCQLDKTPKNTADTATMTTTASYGTLHINNYY